jgi:immune inhibitor A
VPSIHPSLPAVPVFNDENQYWRTEISCIELMCFSNLAGVYHPHTGTIIEVRSVSTQGDFMQVQVRPAKSNQGKSSSTVADATEQFQIFLPSIMR